MLWRYTVTGDDIHFVTSGFEVKSGSPDQWHRQIVGSEREALLEQINNVTWGGRVKGKRRVFDEPESNKKQKPQFPAPTPPKPPKSTSSKSPKPSSGTIITTITNAPPGTTLKNITIGKGSHIAIRADMPEDGFMIAQVTEQTVIKNIGTEDANHIVIPIRWYVEGREAGLRGNYCFPQWRSTVEYGAVVRVGVRLAYLPETDMYRLEDDYDSILALL